MGLGPRHGTVRTLRCATRPSSEFPVTCGSIFNLTNAAFGLVQPSSPRRQRPQQETSIEHEMAKSMGRTSVVILRKSNDRSTAVPRGVPTSRVSCTRGRMHKACCVRAKHSEYLFFREPLNSGPERHIKFMLCRIETTRRKVKSQSATQGSLYVGLWLSAISQRH